MFKKGYIPWNKGKTCSLEQVEKIRKTLKGRQTRKTGISDEEKKNISIRMSLKNPGGKAKWFDYKGQKLQGTWEYNLAQKLDELGILWYKPKVHKDVWKYEVDGKIKSYTPDFFLPEENLYLEVKGYWWGTDKLKMTLVKEQHQDKRLLIIEKEQYEKIMQGELVW